MKRRHVGHVTLAAASLSMLLLATACGSSSSSSTSSSAGSSASASAVPAASSAAGGASSSGAASSAAGTASSAGGTPSSAGGTSAASGAKLPAANLSLLFGSSGTAETNALKAAAAAWGKQSGSTVTVTPAANEQQQLAQGFSAGTAPDIFYAGAGDVATYAKAGNMLAYGDQMPNKGDFYPTLIQSFTVGGKLICAPKDVSTLALFINTEDWTKAGLTDADIPKNWDQLAAVAKKLTSGGQVGLSIGATRDRIDAFLAQNGGGLTSADQKTATANSDANVAALTYVKKLLTDGVMKFPGDLSAGWAGEAFGKNKAAMTIEGNWLLGSMKTDYPTIKYKVVELPTGPTGTKGTLAFTNCWGISATTKNSAQAEAFVQYLTSPSTQMTFADAFGVIPSVKTAQAQYLAKYPSNAPFVNGIAYAQGVLTAPGTSAVLSDMDSQLEKLATSDPKTILNSVQDNLSTALGG
ncbi:multiple sugar transport system substrate-binding protein [Nakamurella panacisegetis]|uniref:Multiple sugar transport system substrate-binding protein n=1 Tax=Nakamurella panacisegetis TaxID=1090615 RepID=A0A1H0JNF1_9ACTN|nr:extracellular solute-binding protein [Nakamurella panacisegetis]SDO45050.1 multiple sugar transport system substrate-binding protein [Nakamurella panacisegetis]